MRAFAGTATATTAWAGAPKNRCSVPRTSSKAFAPVAAAKATAIEFITCPLGPRPSFRTPTSRRSPRSSAGPESLFAAHPHDDPFPPGVAGDPQITGVLIGPHAPEVELGAGVDARPSVRRAVQDH